MIYLLCSVKDTAIGAFLRPFCVRSRGEGMRVFADEVNRVDVNNPLSLHPKDFELWILGTFDDTTGLVVSLAMSCVAVGVDVRLVGD